MTKKATKSTRISIYLPNRELLQAVKDAAKTAGLSMNAWVVRLMQRALFEKDGAAAEAVKEAAKEVQRNKAESNDQEIRENFKEMVANQLKAVNAQMKAGENVDMLDIKELFRLAGQFVGKTNPDTTELEQAYVTLRDSLEHLPDVEDLDFALGEMRKDLEKAQTEAAALADLLRIERAGHGKRQKQELQRICKTVFSAAERWIRAHEAFGELEPYDWSELTAEIEGVLEG